MSYSVVRPLLLNPRRPAQTVVTRGRTQGRADRSIAWTFLVFWFAAGMFGGVALMKSSVGHTPAFQNVAKQIRAFLR